MKISVMILINRSMKRYVFRVPTVFDKILKVAFGSIGVYHWPNVHFNKENKN